MRKYLVLTACIVVVCGIIAFTLNSKRNESGLENIRNYDEFKTWLKTAEKEDRLYYSGGFVCGDTEEEAESFFNENKVFYEKIADGKPSFIHGEFCAMIVKAGSELRIYDGMSENDAVIEKVLTGCSYSEGTEISLVNYSSVMVDRDNNVTLILSKGTIPMIPQNRYLVFCEESELSNNMSRPQFRTFGSAFTYLNLDNNGVIGFMEKNNIEDVLNSEFFAAYSFYEPKIMEIKNEILEKYGL